jgi:colanic acid/amylovoran biosynthesis glycosyltransferase
MEAMGRDFEWRIVGGGPLESELVSSSTQLVASGRIAWLGTQSSQFVLSLLNSWADIFVLPCRTASDGDADGIPVALMEAMTAGVPVVSSSVAGIPELISSGITGYLIEPGDVQALVDYISHLSDFENERAKIAVAAKSFVDREFNLELEAAKMAHILFHPVTDVDPHLVRDR